MAAVANRFAFRASSGDVRGVTYDERAYILDPGDVVAFFSDGIGDAQNLTGDFFGQARLIKLITENQHASADGIADRILEEVDRFPEAPIRPMIALFSC